MATAPLVITITKATNGFVLSSTTATYVAVTWIELMTAMKQLIEGIPTTVTTPSGSAITTVSIS